MILNLDNLHIDDFIAAKDYCEMHHDNYSRYTECKTCQHKRKCLLYQYGGDEQTAVMIKDFIDEIVEPWIEKLYEIRRMKNERNERNDKTEKVHSEKGIHQVTLSKVC